MSEQPKQVFITGVSSGIGLGLTRECLRRQWTVYGLARHAPDLGKSDRFHFVSCDLGLTKNIAPAMNRLLGDVKQLDLAILNAGVLGPFGDLKEHSLEEMQRVMQINVWANKVLLDILMERENPPSQVVTISSGASVSGKRGWGGYAISKAALNSLTALAAAEFTDTHFCALAPGLVDTAMQDQLCSLPSDDELPVLDWLRKKRGTPEMPDGDELAPRLLGAIEQLPILVPSGSYADIRKLSLNAP